MDVSELVVTVEDRNALLSELQPLVQNSDPDTIRSMVNSSSSSYKSHLQELVKDNDPKKTLDDAIKQLKEIPEMNLVVSKRLDEGTLSKIKDWFVTHIGGQVVLDVAHDPSIIGGVQITYKGRYFDGSVAEQVDNYLSGSQVRELIFK